MILKGSLLKNKLFFDFKINLPLTKSLNARHGRDAAGTVEQRAVWLADRNPQCVSAQYHCTVSLHSITVQYHSRFLPDSDRVEPTGPRTKPNRTDWCLERATIVVESL